MFSPGPSDSPITIFCSLFPDRKETCLGLARSGQSTSYHELREQHESDGIRWEPRERRVKAQGHRAGSGDAQEREGSGARGKGLLTKGHKSLFQEPVLPPTGNLPGLIHLCWANLSFFVWKRCFQGRGFPPPLPQKVAVRIR